MRQILLCIAVAVGLMGAIFMIGFQENVVLLWAAVTTMLATSIR